MFFLSKILLSFHKTELCRALFWEKNRINTTMGYLADPGWECLVNLKSLGKKIKKKKILAFEIQNRKWLFSLKIYGQKIVGFEFGCSQLEPLSSEVSNPSAEATPHS